MTFLKRGRGDNKTYINNKRTAPSDYIPLTSSENALVLGRGKNAKILTIDLCPKCGESYLTKSMDVHLQICEGKT